MPAHVLTRRLNSIGHAPPLARGHQCVDTASFLEKGVARLRFPHGFAHGFPRNFRNDARREFQRNAWLGPLIVASLALLLPMMFAGVVPAADPGLTLFETSIRPVLVKHCYECHSSAAAAKDKLQAGLFLDTRAGLLAGGESGPAIVPGQAAKSLLMAALRYESYQMPPTGRLPAAVLDDFAKWIDLGAPDPREGSAPTPRRTAFQITDADRRHWAFLPIPDHPALPTSQLPGGGTPTETTTETTNGWGTDELDRFVLAALRTRNLSPAPAASKPAWLRRATFALTGLPPTPDELAAFAADSDPKAYERAVDRLLDSPEFGVHWARRWLDGVRYADNIDKSGEYRRWVIRAFNDDLRYDQFLKMQIAGDLLTAAELNAAPDRTHASGASFDGVIATGMLSFAAWEQVGRDLAIAEIVDSQIDLIGRQVLGLTLACARCHDHKFDPISTQDYYSLAGIFFSSHIASGKLIADDRLGNDLVETMLLTPPQDVANRELERQAAALDTEVETLVKKIPQAARLVALKLELSDAEGQLAKATAATKTSLAAKTKKLKDEQSKLLEARKTEGWELAPPELAEIKKRQDAARELRKQKFAGVNVVAIREGGVPGGKRERIGDAPVYLRGEFQHEGPIAPRRFPAILAGDQQVSLGARTTQSGRRELAEWLVSPTNPLTARVMANRVWQQIVGRGLVRSPDNFGRLGESPTHPELLDHLARSFIASGWSVKQLARRIALSSTFRQSSLASSELARQDPDNLLLARMNRRRLTYEELRDSLTRLGTAAPEKSTSSPNAIAGPTRRTIFEPLDRRKTDVTAALFDGPDPQAIVAVRAESTTAPQALFLMNNPLVLETAKRLAKQLRDDRTADDDAARIERLWLVALGRPITADEAAAAAEFLREQSLESLTHAVLASNEFCYLD
jgi:hypothetical protein